MKVLLSAIACHPHWGSESKVGWDVACAVSQLPSIEECHVITHSNGKDGIKTQQNAGEAADVRFHYYGNPSKPHPNRMIARLQSWLVYRSWQEGLPGFAAELHRRHPFALTHHVTFATWRMPSRLWQLPIPFIFGPVGGGSRMPAEFRKMLGPTARMFELFRGAATCFASNSSALKLCCTRSAAVVAADRQTAAFLAAHGAKNVRTLCQVFFSDQQASRFDQRTRPVRPDDSDLRIFAGGNLEGRKGTCLALQALARLKRSGIAFKYVYGGGGPDKKAMLNLAGKLGIADKVFFHNGFIGADYERQLAESDVYLLPSVRETAGITMMEAVLAGCYPVVLAETGAGDIVQNTGGTAIEAASMDEAVEKIAAELTWLHRHRSEMRRKAGEASSRMRSLYSRDAYKKAICGIYAEAIERHRAKPL